MASEVAVTQVLATLRAAASKVGRSPSSITLVAVSKTKTVAEMSSYAEYASREGVSVVFGENYLQEIKAKRAKLPPGSELHMIGPLQSNKVRDAVQVCDVIESVHSLKTLNFIAKEAARISKRQRILLQVNIGEDPNKSGFTVDALGEAIGVCIANPQAISLEGLMTILPYEENPEASRPYFQEFARLRSRLIGEGHAHHFANDTISLSMGMSNDFHIAIEEGADIVRVGTALFGERNG